MYGPGVDPIEVRRRIGMVFQKPNPFPKSIYDNVAYGPRVTGMKVSSMDDVVEQSLRSAALWDEVKDRLKQSAYSLSGGQQQRLCIARAIAVKPEVILMDEPCSALDPIATARIEDLMHELRQDYTIIIVTHNMQQAARVADRTAFFTALAAEGSGDRTGQLVEFDVTTKMFSTLRQAHRGLHLRSLRLSVRAPRRPRTHQPWLDQRVLITQAGAPALLTVVADATRWRILTALATEELCTTHLQDVLAAKQTLVSHHLRVLREAGLVQTSPCGRFTYYRLAPGALDDVTAALGGLAAASHRTPARRPC